MPDARGTLAAALVGILFGCLVSLPWEASVDSTFVRDTSHDAEISAPIDNAAYTRRTERIASHGTHLEAWVYVPKGLSEPPPVVIMGHGLGAQKDVGLSLFSDRFARNAMAVVVFDYRSFGGSDGEPRHWVSAARHQQDYLAVLDHVQSTNLNGTVDGRRAALWGVSYSGGHVLVLAARLGGRVKAVVANEPFLRPPSPWEDHHFPDVSRTLRLLAAAISDRLRAALGMGPVYVRLAAPMRERALALVPLQDSDLGHSRALGGGGGGAGGGGGGGAGAGPRRYLGGWQNKVLARCVFDMLAYKPVDRVAAITAPTFFRAGSRDHLAPPAAVRAAAARMVVPTVVQELNASHIEAHPEGIKPHNLRPLISFLHEHLSVPAAAAAAAESLSAALAAAAGEAGAAGAGGGGGGGGAGVAPARDADADDLVPGQFPVAE